MAKGRHQRWQVYKTILLLYFSVILIACIIYNIIIIDSERNISEVDYNLPCSLFSNTHFKREWIRTTIKESEVCWIIIVGESVTNCNYVDHVLTQPKWIQLIHNPKESFYYSKMKDEPKIYRQRVKDVLINTWPLSDDLPDMVHYYNIWACINTTIQHTNYFMTKINFTLL